MSKHTAPTKANYHTFADGVRYVLQQLGGVSILTVFRTMLIILNIMVIIFLYNVVTSQQTVEKIIDRVVEDTTEAETADMNIRDQVGPQIMSNLNKLLYSLNADRTFVIELHNGKHNATNMPFKFFDMTYEEINDERSDVYISDNFTQVMVSHYKLPFWLANHHKFLGNVDDLADIDGRFAVNFENFGGKYLCITLLRNRHVNLGFLGVAYNDTANVKPIEEMEAKLAAYEHIIAPLLDLTTQREKMNN